MKSWNFHYQEADTTHPKAWSNKDWEKFRKRPACKYGRIWPPENK